MISLQNPNKSLKNTLPLLSKSHDHFIKIVSFTWWVAVLSLNVLSFFFLVHGQFMDMWSIMEWQRNFVLKDKVRHICFLHMPFSCFCKTQKSSKTVETVKKDCCNLNIYSFKTTCLTVLKDHGFLLSFYCPFKCHILKNPLKFTVLHSWTGQNELYVVEDFMAEWESLWPASCRMMVAL